MTSRGFAWVACGALAAFLCLTAGRAGAQDMAAAARAFSAAQRAELDDDLVRAATNYETANEIASTVEALRGAARTRLAAGHTALAATHALELQRLYPDDSETLELANDIVNETAAVVSKLEVLCGPAACSLILDARAVFQDERKRHVFYTEPGHHELVAFFDGDATPAQTITTKAGSADVLSFEPRPVVKPTPEPAPPTAAPSPPPAPAVAAPPAPAPKGDAAQTTGDGLHVGWFIGAATLTGALAAFSIWSAVDTARAHESYLQQPTIAGYEDGVDRERRTNVLLVGTAMLGATTFVFALLSDWSTNGAPRTGLQGAAVVASDEAAALVAGGAF